MRPPLVLANLAMSKINAVTVAVGGAAMALMAVHVITDVSARYFLGRPLDGTSEVVSRYYMVALVFLPLAYVQANDRHIYAGSLSELLPARALPLLRALSALLMGVFIALLAWRCSVEAMRSTAIGEQIQTAYYFLPTWPARWIPPLAGVLVVAQSIISVCTDLIRFIYWDRHDPSGRGEPQAPVMPV